MIFVNLDEYNAALDYIEKKHCIRNCHELIEERMKEMIEEKYLISTLYNVIISKSIANGFYIFRLIPY